MEEIARWLVILKERIFQDEKEVDAKPGNREILSHSIDCYRSLREGNVDYVPVEKEVNLTISIPRIFSNLRQWSY